MSIKDGDRYEIFDDGPCIRIVSPDSIISTVVGRPVGYYVDDVVIAAIRQQARDLDQLRADLAAAVARAEQAEARLAAIDAQPSLAIWGGWIDVSESNVPPDEAELIARPAKD